MANFEKITVTPETLVDTARSLKSAGFTFLEFMSAVDYIPKNRVEPGENRIDATYMLWNPGTNEQRMIVVPLSRDNPSVPTVMPVWEGANWHEREAHELFGIDIKGHPNQRHLLLAEGWNDTYPLRKDFNVDDVEIDWSAPTSKLAEGNPERVYHFAVQHPGAHGPQGFDLLLDGNKIIDAEARIGYVHRTLEKLGEQRNYYQNILNMERGCIMCGMPYIDVWARAVEELMGIEVPEKAKYLRLIGMELNRLSSHLLWMGPQQGGDFSYTPVAMWAIGDREKVLDLLEALTGGRVTFAYIRPGGVRWDIPEGFREMAERNLRYLESRLPMYEEMMFKEPIVKERLMGLGKLTPAEAIDIGASGPVLRATGIAHDTRKDAHIPIYEDLGFQIVTRTEGDAWARGMVRLGEMKESIRLILEALDRLPPGSSEADLYNRKAMPWMKVPVGETYAVTESCRGRLGIHLVSDGTNKPYRTKIRGPSFSNMYVVEHALKKGSYLYDIPALIGSMDTCPADMDR